MEQIFDRCDSSNEEAAELFAGWEETMIWSCLQGCMGQLYINRQQEPTAAQAVVGDFSFYAGQPDEQLLHNIPDGFASDFLLMVPQHDGWAKCIESVFGQDAEKLERFAIKKEPGVFDRAQLSAFCEKLPPGYSLHMIDREIYEKTKAAEWSRDLTSQFSSYEDYSRWGIGAAVLHDGELAAGASSYTVYREGIEIEIDTEKSHRRKGLALACGAQLILACLDRGLYPSWDAHDMRSVRLAERFGYHLDKAYPTYLVKVSRTQKK